MNGSAVTAYIGLGSNIGDRAQNLDLAVTMLDQHAGIQVTAVSAHLNTAPVGYTDQPDFLNAVAELSTLLSAYELLQVCGEIEQKLKRTRLIHWGPRTIDLDILLYGDLILNDESLIIPHPRMHERQFVLEPLNSIAPTAFHPVLKKNISELYEALIDPHCI